MQRFFLFALFVSFGFTVATAEEKFRFEENENARTWTLFENGKPVLTYVYDVVAHENVPEKDQRRTAGCYVHPVYGLNGEILTDNAPKDHYHHHGVFWTWPHVGVHQSDGKVVHHDLWLGNTGLKQHFVRSLDRKTTEESASFSVENAWLLAGTPASGSLHLAGTPASGEKIMKEEVSITVHRSKTVDGLKSRAIDFSFKWTPTDKPISLRGAEEKSYGGLSIRLRPFVEPKKNQAGPSKINVITVPSGPAANDLPDTPLAWADYTSRFGDDDKRSGAALFVPKTHPDYPPTWLTRYYGPLCIGWPGVKDRTFQPGEEIKLQYRLWIHDAPVDVKQLEKAYDEYCSP